MLMRRLAGEGPAVQAGLATMRDYVHRRRCRRRTLLAYLGETGVRCSGCDRCGVPSIEQETRNAE
jgi:superfamily II DNA helicase RecQ